MGILLKKYRRYLRRHPLEIRQVFSDFNFIILGLLSASFGLKGFLLPNHFLDGGITGCSLLVAHVTNVPLPVLIVVLNIPFIILGLKQVGGKFAIKTMLAILGLALCLVFVPWPEITHDKLLIAFFGGFFLGLGIALCIRGGCVIDGTEVMAIYASKNTALSLGDFIMIVNVLIFGVSAWVFNTEIAMYAILTYLSASKTVDFIVQGIEEYTGVTIISSRSQQVRAALLHHMGRGVTVYKGERGLSAEQGESADQEIIFTVITRLELSRLKNEVKHIDPNAFIFTTPVGETTGGMIKRRPLH